MSENNDSQPATEKHGRNRSTRVRGDLLRRQRIDRGWTQSETADASGLSERLIRLAESGGPIESNSIASLSRTLEIPPEAIVCQSLPPTDRAPAAAMAKRFLEQIWNFGNLDVIEELQLPEFRFYHEQGVVNGREELRQRIRTFRESFTDFDLVVEDARDFESFVVCRWRATMTHVGPWLSLPATNRRVTIFGSSWVQIVNGKFGDAWDYWDPQLLFQELAR